MTAVVAVSMCRSRYEQFDISPVMIEPEFRPVVCEQRQADNISYREYMWNREKQNAALFTGMYGVSYLVKTCCMRLVS